jgi:transcriptional regulator GlxA family with amidase domain
MKRPPLSLDPDAFQRPYWAERHLFRNEKTPVAIRWEKTQTATASHSHEFAEFVLVLGGSGIHEIGAQRYPLVPGEFFLVTGHLMHAYRDVKNLDILNILIRHQTIEALTQSLAGTPGYERLFRPKSHPFHGLPPILPGAVDHLLQIVKRMEQELFQVDAGSPAMLTALLTELLITACRLTDAPGGADRHRSRIADLVAHLERHYGEPVTLADMGQIAGMSARTLQRHFAAVTRITPLQYLLQLRIAGACRLLRETDMKANEIAVHCGIPDPAYFSRLFRQAIGVSPRAYRNRLSATAP